MRKLPPIETAVTSRVRRPEPELIAGPDRHEDDFLTMLGHELRNPLAAMTTAVQLMRLHTDDPRRVARARETIERQIEQMTRLIDALLHDGSAEATRDGAAPAAEYVIRLPVHEASSQATANDGVTTVPLDALPKRRILVVDDNVDAADALAELLRDYGHDVRAVHDGPSAMEQAGLHRPDIVLLDIAMPGFDGYEVARRMRSELGLQATLIAVTGYGEARHRRQSREAGFDQHVTKPVDARKLETLLKLPN
jgi:CheY-like chemotaxis protein